MMRLLKGRSDIKVLIVYYNTCGNVYSMAEFIAEGVCKVNGAEPMVCRVPELIPESIIES